MNLWRRFRLYTARDIVERAATMMRIRISRRDVFTPTLMPVTLAETWLPALSVQDPLTDCP